MITDKHVLFARALVALAREHDMTNIDLTYRRGYVFPAEPGGPEQHQMMRLLWSAGRHGAEARIKLQTESNQDITEKA